MNKILITGNMGYVGSVIVQHLRKAYPDVTLNGFDYGYFSHCLINVPQLPECSLNNQIFGDIRQFSDTHLEGVDTLIHLAALSNDPIGNRYEDLTMEVNFHSTMRLANLAKLAGVKRFVFASSCSVYGFSEQGPRNEQSPVNPLTAYARSKVRSEEILKTLASSEFNITCLRFATACGISPRLRLDLVLNDFVASAVIDKKITVLSDGTPWRPLIDVKDMARAVDWAINREADVGGAFLVVNVGADQWNFRVHELAEAVARAIPDLDISLNKNAMPDHRSYKVNFDLYKSLAAGYQPEQNLETTIKELKDGIDAMGCVDNWDAGKSFLIRLHVLEMLRNKGLLTADLKWKAGGK
ncbi:NAD-dependent epimerase [Cohnella kolymensis]|uniref:NAD-dependent epimerase n=1 Tax=Cohnella kolymensis TaxID=1590652 RepID=A0ABR5A837_9BACL|nr:SDR family oxidoreductase [Cohnella kolymensis]KIL36983.1 NAD-dependent epimerase [Cohnella kolymensis]